MTLRAFEGDSGFRGIARTAASQAAQNPIRWLSSYLESEMAFEPRQAELAAGMMLLAVSRPEFGAACLALKQSLLGIWTHKAPQRRPFAGRYCADITEIAVYPNYRYSYYRGVTTPDVPLRGPLGGVQALSRDEHAGVVVPLAVPRRPMLLLLCDGGAVKKAPVRVQGTTLLLGPTQLERRLSA
jgi:hypothetical protein